ncbi:penicillin-binding protein 1C, partial [Variovorax sp. CT11-76]
PTPRAAAVTSLPLRGYIDHHSPRLGPPLVVDDALVGRAAPGEGIAWMPDLAESGRRYVLRVVDDQGRAESREVIVDIAP